MTSIGLATPKKSTVRVRIYSLIVVIPSDRSIENFVIGKYERSAPTSVMSVPCRVVINGSRRLVVICCASSAEMECGIA